MFIAVGHPAVAGLCYVYAGARENRDIDEAIRARSADR